LSNQEGSITTSNHMQVRSA